MVQAVGEDVITTLTTICHKIWQTGKWPTPWTQSLVITLPKKGNLQQCQNYGTISLISHPNKVMLKIILNRSPQWGAADAEIKVPSGENTELKRPPFKAWSRSVYSHTCYAYCHGFLPCLFLPFRSIHLHFSRNLSRFFLFKKHDLWYDDLRKE